jgi:hypothetical protein
LLVLVWNPVVYVTLLAVALDGREERLVLLD